MEALKLNNLAFDSEHAFLGDFFIHSLVLAVTKLCTNVNSGSTCLNKIWEGIPAQCVHDAPPGH